MPTMPMLMGETVAALGAPELGAPARARQRLNLLYLEPAARERVQFGACQRPWRALGRAVGLVAGRGDDEQRSAWRDKSPDPRDRARSHRRGQGLHGQRLEDERERLGPGLRRLEQVGDD